MPDDLHDSIPLVRIEFEYADGTVRRLTGNAAEIWKDRMDSALFMAWIHGVQSGMELPWETVPATPEQRERYRLLTLLLARQVRLLTEQDGRVLPGLSDKETV